MKSLLENEAYLLCHIKAFGLPEMKTFGYNSTYNILIMELLGPSLENLFQEKTNILKYNNDLENKLFTNTNENFNRQNIINTEENINANMAYMNQEQMAQADEGYDLSKLYIATKITPVYSEMLDQQFQTHTHVCKVCGNAYDDNQMEMMQQNQINSMQEQNQVNSMQEMEYDINCPIHGQYFTQ